MTMTEINDLEPEQMQRLWDLYVQECQLRSTYPDISDFYVWCEER